MAVGGAPASSRAELVAVAQAMLDGETNLIEGARRICALRHDVGEPDNDVFVPIIAMESETDHFPLGQMREHCASDYLQRMDDQMETYLEEARIDVLAACKDILRAFSFGSGRV
jgi:hypothetical protein